jgi:hypothetical protein
VTLPEAAVRMTGPTKSVEVSRTSEFHRWVPNASPVPPQCPNSPPEIASAPLLTVVSVLPPVKLVLVAHWSHSASGLLSPDHPRWEDQVATPPVHSSDT